MFKEAKIKSEYSGFIDLVLERKDDKTIATKKFYEGLVKIKLFSSLKANVSFLIISKFAPT